MGQNVLEKKTQLTPEQLEKREQVIAHGLVGIQLKPEQLRKLFQLADAQGLTPNVLARRWILEHLEADQEQ
jgi:hypothetical protein